MEVIQLTKKNLEKLIKYTLPENLFTAEADLLILPIENKWEKTNKLIKKFYVTEGSFFRNKLETIKLLLQFKNTINIPQLVFPESLVIVDNEIIGYSMELVKSINLEIALLSDEISIERKIKYLYQIGEILDKMEQVRKYTPLKQFFLNDVHENNFIIDINTDNVRVIDLDSCKIDNNIPLTIGSRYLQSDTIITKIPKYKQDKNFVYGCSFIPSRDTDLYCYIIMILNFLYGGEIEKLSIEELYDYLEYLSSIGASKQLINSFKKILSSETNENPYKMLNEIINLYGRAHKNVFKRVYRK